jgi:hypothetical protein
LKTASTSSWALLADLLGRIGLEPQALQPRVDRLDVRAEAALARRHVAVDVFADEHHDLAVLDAVAAGGGELRVDQRVLAGLRRGCRLRLGGGIGEPEPVLGLRERRDRQARDAQADKQNGR